MCTVYCGRGCLSLESEGKENERLREFLARTTDNGQRDTRGVLRGPRGPKKDFGVFFKILNRYEKSGGE